MRQHTRDFSHLIGTGLQVSKDGCTACLGFLSIGGAGFDVLDLDGDAFQAVAGVGELFDAETAVGSVLKGDCGHLAICALGNGGARLPLVSPVDSWYTGQKGKGAYGL